MILETVQNEQKNEELIVRLNQSFAQRLEIIRGGSVAVAAVYGNKE